MYGATAGAAVGKRKDRGRNDEPLMQRLPLHLREEFPAEYELFDSLVDFNQQVDARLAKSLQMWHGYFVRKREGGLGKNARTLRLCIYNTHANQAAHYGVLSEGAALDAPRWTLRIEGRMLEDVHDQQQQQQQQEQQQSNEYQPKFSHFIKHVSVELNKEQYKNDWFVEWDSRRHVGETDGFELTREGDRETTVKILIEVAYPIQLYSLSQPLVRLMGGAQTETHDAVLRCIWLHCKSNDLVSGATITCDALLKGIFGEAVENVELDNLPALVRPHLTPVPPLEVEYVVRVNGTPEESMRCWDIQVQDVATAVKNSMTSGKGVDTILECDREVSALMEQIGVASKKQKAFAAMAKDPVQFVHMLMRSEARDASLLEAKEDSESHRNASFYYHPYVVDAARQYLLRQRAVVAEKAALEEK